MSVAHPVAAEPLGLVKGAVGSTQRGLQVAVAECCEAYADREVQRPTVDLEG